MAPPVTEQHLITGAAGVIEVLLDMPSKTPIGLALIAHPHPLFGGSNTNKVTHTLARTLRDLGYVALRPNFRGVGQTAGEHDDGKGEMDDLYTVLQWAKQRHGPLPTVLAGFSFGAYVQTKLAQTLNQSGQSASWLILVGTASGFIEGARHYETRAVSSDTLVIHGSNDQTVPLANVLQWAAPLNVPIVLIPGADHFFHGKLSLLRDIILRAHRAPFIEKGI